MTSWLGLDLFDGELKLRWIAQALEVILHLEHVEFIVNTDKYFIIVYTVHKKMTWFDTNTFRNLLVATLNNIFLDFRDNQASDKFPLVHGAVTIEPRKFCPEQSDIPAC